MSILLAILVIWFVVSVPASLIIAAVLRKNSDSIAYEGKRPILVVSPDYTQVSKRAPKLPMEAG